MGEVDKTKKKQDVTGLTRRHKIALWMAIVTALGSQGIPEIVRLLENKPSTEEVQAMIGQQTESITLEINKTVEALKALDLKLSSAKDVTTEMRVGAARVQTRLELLQDVLRDCCTRRSGIRKLEKMSVEGTDTPPTVVMGLPKGVGVDYLKQLLEEAKKKTPEVELLKKVPAFKMQQEQLQMLEPGE